ncbi:hypothetical protein J5Y04_21165 [Kitasatospora sp. RG8]|uniref:hypothetical protein n=1 Tax=Kitasatospora sp. RG8 TaxID=2820815 RepID=UPI001ADEF18C|nr:hypothetical protein [Kitasatospora sp. RG8]MBP0452029.1 hypothetical protein [Kitasatospora sp. RG8]
MDRSTPYPRRARAWSPPRTILRLAIAATELALAAVTVPASAAPVVSPGAPVPPAAVQPGRFVQTDLTRLLDTRAAIGVPAEGPLGGDSTLRFPVGQLAAGATAVVLNVTATDTTGDSFVTVHPDGQSRPRTSNLNFTPGQTVANLVTVPVSNGYVDVYNHLGSANLIADLFGYYTDDPAVAASTFQAVTPSRALDTRTTGPGGTAQPVGADATVNLELAGRNRVPAAGATAVVLNVTATDSTGSSFLTVYPHGTSRPVTSNLNFTAGQTVPNLVTVPLGADGSVDLYNHVGTANLVVDVFGFYTGAPSGSGFTSTGPSRVLDTRDPGRRPVGQGGILSWSVSDEPALPAGKVSAVVLNVTATGPTAASHLDVYPGGSPRPSSSNLNYRAGETVANTVIVPVDRSGDVNFYNNAGSVDVVVDLFGYFTAPQGGPTGLSMDDGGCDSPSPGRWFIPNFGASKLGATAGKLPGASGPVWTQMVLTGPEGTKTFATDAAQPDGRPVSALIFEGDVVKGNAYSWYAYTTDGVHTSPASTPCYFRASQDPGFTMTMSDPSTSPIYMGQTMHFAFTATTDEIEPGFQPAYFRYSFAGIYDTEAPTVPAVNGAATVDVVPNNWGIQNLTVTAVSVDGTRKSYAGRTFYVIWR